MNVNRSGSAPPTERLYYDDSLLVEFEAQVVAHTELAGRPSVVLDRSAFYPESGGQMADRGILGGLGVVDVQVDESGVVHHVLDAELPPTGSLVAGRIDLERRRLHMALHTGQHILSRALLDVAGAETVSSRLGETACTIDVDLAGLGEREVSAAEALANSIVESDVPVRAFFPNAAELDRIPLRRKPKVTAHVRVVQIGDFDFSPCGGTHCRSAAQVGFVHVTGVERYKGGTRVTFGAGRRARDLLVGESALLRTIAHNLSSGPEGVSVAIEKLRRELSAAREALGQVRAQIAQQKAEELISRARADGRRMVVAQLDGATLEVLRAIAQRVTEEPEAVALLAGSADDAAPVVVVRGSRSSFDCGAFLKHAMSTCGGRGGGRPERAEGKLPPGVDWVLHARPLLESQ
jgi:alanyl-tRNA synthetase